MVSVNASGPPDDSRELSRRQKEILQVIRESVQSRGYPPSLREIAQAVGLASPSTVSYHLSVLEERGFLSRGSGLPRTTVELSPGHEAGQSAAPGADVEDPVRVPLVGRIAAGVPITAEQAVEDTFLLPRKIVGHGTLFMLRVSGDSMVNAGISDGDYVVIRQQEKVVSGDIVAALIEGIEPEATVKTFQQAEDGLCWLMPHNPDYAPIPGNGAEIMGRVVAVLRMV